MCALACSLFCAPRAQQVTPRNLAPTFSAMAVVNEKFVKLSLDQYTKAGQSEQSRRDAAPGGRELPMRRQQARVESKRPLRSRRTRPRDCSASTAAVTDVSVAACAPPISRQVGCAAVLPLRFHIRVPH